MTTEVRNLKFGARNSFRFRLNSALRFAFLAFFCGYFISPCFAEDKKTATTAAPTDSLDELLNMPIPVVEAASKYKQKTSEAPSSVTVISSDEIKRYGHRTLADILRTVPGINVSYDRD